MARSTTCKQRMLSRKFFYVLTCEYCVSHYVTAVVLDVTDYKLLFDDWRGFFVTGFSLFGRRAST
jgi:hypothetical protein